MRNGIEFYRGNAIREGENEKILQSKLKDFLSKINIPDDWSIILDDFMDEFRVQDYISVDFFNEKFEDKDTEILSIVLEVFGGENPKLEILNCHVKIRDNRVTLKNIKPEKVYKFLEKYEQIYRIFEEIDL